MMTRRVLVDLATRNERRTGVDLKKEDARTKTVVLRDADVEAS